MQDPTKPKSGTLHIAEAIRAKRERRSVLSSDAALDAMEASLLADIDNFDLDAASRQVEANELQLQSTGLLVVDMDLAFPEILEGGSRPRVELSPTSSARAEPVGASTGSAAGGLLDQLRQQAEVFQVRRDAECQQLSENEARVDLALRQVFSYLHELVQQLNVIKPPVPRNYLVAGSQELQDMVWQQGFTDYRTRPQSAGALMESVSFNYRLAGKEGLVMERDGTVAENFRQFLFDLNLNVKVEEFRNERRYLERARFAVAPEVTVNVRWEADFEQGAVIVLIRNLERLGAVRYRVVPELVNQALLDEFGRLILGQSSQFQALIRPSTR